VRIPRRQYAELYGPTAGDRFRLADTNLVCEIERILAGLAAIVLPYKLKDLFEASPVRWRVAGVPVLSIAGGLSIVGMGVIEYAYLNDPNSGISFKAPAMILVNVAVLLSGFVFYAVTRFIRARQGVNLGLAFAEIPPE
jgi:hypothetical protein